MLDLPATRRLTLHNPWTDVKYGESIAINGCCLTVAEIGKADLAFDVIAESLGMSKSLPMSSRGSTSGRACLRNRDAPGRLDTRGE